MNRCLCLLICLIASLSSPLTHAQDPLPPTLKPVAVEGLPQTVGTGVVTTRGDLFYILKPAEQRPGRQMGSLLGSGSIYQREPILFGSEERAELRFHHIAQAEDETRWAVADGVALYEKSSESWQEITLPKIRHSAGCAQWERYGSPCQLIIPIAATRAIVLQPRQDAGVLGTDVLALEEGTARPLGEAPLAGVALGPAVQDGQGGFWVLVRKGKGDGGMNGYLHYTRDGKWLLWNDTQTPIPGTTLAGMTQFQVNPDVRKMAADGQGGFFAIGKDRILYRISPDGVAAPFSPAQPVCQYCQPVSLAFDAQKGTLHLLSGQWRIGEAGVMENISPMVIYTFAAAGGQLLDETLLPLTPESERNLRSFYADVLLAAGAGQIWVTAPNLVVHRQGAEWAWLTAGSQVQQVMVQQEQARVQARANPALAYASSLGLWTIGLGGMAGSYLLGTRDTDSSIAPQYAIYLPLLGSGLGWFTGSFFYPQLGEDQQASWARLGTTGAIHAIGIGSLTLFLGNAFGELAIRDSSVTEDYRLVESGGILSTSALGAYGGALVGTVLSAWLTSAVIDYDPASQLDVWLGGFATSALSSLGYFIFTPRWSDDNYILNRMN